MNKLGRHNMACYMTILISIFVSALFSIEIAGAGICFFVSFILAKNNYLIKNCGVLVFGFVLIVFQNLMIGLGAHLGGNFSDSLKYLTQIPTIYIVCVGGYCFLKEKKKNLIDYLAMILIFYLVLSFFISSASVAAKLVYVRNCSCFYFAYLLGKQFCVRSNYIKFLNLIINISMVVALLGIILMLAPAELWAAIGIKEVYIAKGAGGSFYATQLPVRFYTSIGKYRFYRLASILYEPVNLSYILSFASLLLFFTKEIRKRFLKIIILCSSMILTFGKGGILTFSIVIAYYCCSLLINGLRAKLSTNAKRISIIIIIIIITTIAGIFYYIFIGGSATAHFHAIMYTFTGINDNLWGAGLGFGGNNGDTLNNNSGQESGLMSIMYQLGLPFTIMFMLCFLCMTIKSSRKKDRMAIAASIMPMSILVACLFQENTLGPQCCYLFMCFAGIWAKDSNLNKAVPNDL